MVRPQVQVLVCLCAVHATQTPKGAGSTYTTDIGSSYTSHIGQVQELSILCAHAHAELQLQNLHPPMSLSYLHHSYN